MGCNYGLLLSRSNRQRHRRRKAECIEVEVSKETLVGGVKKMSKAIAFIAGSWCSYCAMVGVYDGAMAILDIYGILAIKKGYDRRKQSHPNKKSLQKEV